MGPLSFFHALKADWTFRIHDLEAQGLYSNPSQFYDFLQNRVMVVFRPKFEEADPDQPEFNLVLSKKQNYDAVCSLFIIPNPGTELSVPCLDGSQSR